MCSGKNWRDRHTPCPDLEGCGHGGGVPWPVGLCHTPAQAKVGDGPEAASPGSAPPPTRKQPQASGVWGGLLPARTSRSLGPNWSHLEPSLFLP